MRFPSLIKRLVAAWATVSLGGCGTVMTRPFEPVSEPPEAARGAAFAEAFTLCVRQVTGTDAVDYNGTNTSTGVSGKGAVAGSAAVAVLGGSGLYDVSMLGAAVLFPVALGYGALRGVAAIDRDGTETEIQTKVTACMAAKNYKIVGWTMVKKGHVSHLVTPVAKPSTLKPARQ